MDLVVRHWGWVRAFDRVADEILVPERQAGHIQQGRRRILDIGLRGRDAELDWLDDLAAPLDEPLEDDVESVDVTSDAESGGPP